MVILYKSVKNGGQGKENSAYDKFGEIANAYIANLNGKLPLIENIYSDLSYNIKENMQDRSLNSMKKSTRFTYTNVDDLMNDQLTLFEELELANLRQDLDLYLEGVDDGYAGTDKKDYINEEYSRGYEVGKKAKEKEERFNEFKTKLAAYKAAHQK